MQKQKSPILGGQENLWLKTSCLIEGDELAAPPPRSGSSSPSNCLLLKTMLLPGRVAFRTILGKIIAKTLDIPQIRCIFAIANTTDRMRIAIVQHDIRWGQPAENLQRLSLLLDQQQGADLYVLSETFTTGFLAKGVKGEDAEEGLKWLQQQAKEKDAAFAASIATTDADGQLRNRLYFVRPDGTFSYYDKRHLFGYAGETDAYVAGQERVIAEWRGMRFLLQICYDLRFPIWSRNLQDYDAAIYVANWPASRIDVWQTLLKARALENQCFVVGVNRVGKDPACNYCGGSTIIDAYGKTIAQCKDNEEGIAVADLDIAQLKRFREKFPVLQDADDFTLKTT